MSMEKMDPLLGLNSAEQMTIQKSTPLLSLWRSPLTLSEFKILDAYLARIDSHHPDRRWVRFSKGELEAILHVEKINITDLNTRIKNLCIMVQIENPALTADGNEGFDEVALFERAICKKDAEGVWTIDLCCTPSAMQYIFNVENLGYLRYKLRSIVCLTSRYSYLLFLYLERNRFRGNWEVSVNELRDYLGCTDSTYSQYKFFNQFILKRAQQELESKTNCHFSYKPIRQGRRISHLHFFLEPLLEEKEEVVRQTNTASAETSLQAEINALLSACRLPNGEPEFTSAEITQILSILPHIPRNKFPHMSLKFNRLLAWKQYLEERYAAMNRLAEKKVIRHRFNYLLKMIKADVGMK